MQSINQPNTGFANQLYMFSSSQRFGKIQLKNPPDIDKQEKTRNTLRRLIYQQDRCQIMYRKLDVDICGNIAPNLPFNIARITVLLPQI